MDPRDEKFFESLAGAKSEADASYEVELTKADGAVMARARSARVPKPESKSGERTWADGEPEGQLTVDVFQTPTEIVVESAIAGVRPEDIDVSVTPDSISIRGARHHERRSEEEDYLYQECYWGRFARSIILPQEIDPEGADVIFKNGILTVHLPKANVKKSRKLRVRME